MIRQINNNLEREKNPKEPSVMQKEFRSKVLAYLWVEGEDTSNPTEEEIRLAKEEQIARATRIFWILMIQSGCGEKDGKPRNPDDSVGAREKNKRYSR